MEEEIDLSVIWESLKKNWKVIVVLPVIMTLVAGIISIFILKPEYKASTTLIVGAKTATASQDPNQLLALNVLQANQQLAKTYGTIVKSRTVGDRVIKELNLAIPTDVLISKVSVTLVPNTEVLEISVTDNNPEFAASVANSFAKNFSDAVIDIKKVDSVSLIDAAIAPSNPIKPNKKNNIVLGFTSGILLAFGFVIAKELLDNTLKSAKDIEQVLNLPVIGVIPYYEENLLKG